MCIGTLRLGISSSLDSSLRLDENPSTFSISAVAMFVVQIILYCSMKFSL